MTRALLIVLDSVGIGGAEDAHAYGDMGADTVGHIAQACKTQASKQGTSQGGASSDGRRRGLLHLPHMIALGLAKACEASTGECPPFLNTDILLRGMWGYGVETSKGKDTPSGHYEIAGVPVAHAWGVFPNTQPAFPAFLTDEMILRGDIPGILGNCHASGTQILDDLGAQHLATGQPIVYTSVDSVVQIAAHEAFFGLERLYALCQLTRQLCDPLHVGRVIARPFLGNAQEGFTRTGNRRDFAMPPPAPTLLDHLTKQGREVISIGKIGDIFAHSGTGREIRAHGNNHVLDEALGAFYSLKDGGLVFANLLDFDSEYGHRRDVAGYAAALEAFDARLPEIWNVLKEGDIAIITADHGNDPTWHGTDHTREHVPILLFGPQIQSGSVGRRNTLADIGASIAHHLGIPPLEKGTSFLGEAQIQESKDA
jgi:phosphopentomutase